MRSVRDRLSVLVLSFGLLLAAVAPATAQSLDTAIAGFAADSFGDTEKALGAVAVSGSPQALPIVEALREGRLFFAENGKVYFRDKADRLIDAATGEAAATPPELKPVRVNNRVRRAIDAAMGGLTLLSPEPSKRLEAAQSVFKSKDAALPVLDQAIARESEGRIRTALQEARAAVVLFSESATETARIEAVEVVGGRGNQEAVALLSGLPPATPAAVKEAAARAVADIQRNLALWNAAQNAWYGLSLGSVLLLAAIGLAITFGVMGVINMAHGEMVMLGAYTTFVVQEVMRAHNPALLDWSLVIAVPLAFLVAGAFGVAIERGIIRFLYGRSLETLLATWGLSLILQQAVRTIFGANNREVSAPSWMSGAFEVGQMSITYGRLWIIVFTIAVFVLLLAVLQFTRIGLEMRAVTQNRSMASVMGIRTSWVDAMTFGLGSGIAGIAGVALSQIDNVSPNLGQGYIIDSFMVVVFGGVGNLWGTLVGALSLGIANKFLEPYAGAVLGKIFILVAIILFIQKRPRGLFALKGRSVET
jgi:urea transport system permease protein